MKFTPPVLAVLNQVQGDGFVDTTVEGDFSTYGPPLAPAGLYDVETQRAEALQLHKLIRSEANTHIFRTYRTQTPTDALLGRSFVFRPWWTSKSFALVAEPSTEWRYSVYPNDGTHAHCELTYLGIGADEDDKDGYFLGELWVTRAAYQQYIRDDIFHCRDDA
jgi:hypothetical protein